MARRDAAHALAPGDEVLGKYRVVKVLGEGGMGAVVAGLIAGTGLKLLMELRQHPLGMLLASLVAAAAFGSVALMRWPLVSVVLGLGGAIVALTGWRLRQLQNKAEETM